MAGERILVVDDEASIVEICTRVLSKEGYQLQSAMSGAGALAQLETESFDLLVLDVKMPDINGLALLRQARERDPSLIAVIISGFATLDSAIEAIGSGARGFLLKPFGPQELVTAVQSALAQRQLELERVRMHALLPILQIAQALLAEGDPEYLAEQLLHSVAHELNADQAALFLVDAQGESLSLAGVIGLPLNKETQPHIPRTQLLAGQTLDRQRLLVVNEESHLEAIWEKLVPSPRPTVAAWVPLRTIRRLVGLLYLGRTTRARAGGAAPWTMSDQNLLTIVADQLSVALENARLYETVNRGKEEWETTFDAMSDWVALVGLDGRIFRTNRVGERYAGIPRAEIVGQKCFQLVHGSNERIDECPVRRMLETGQQARAEILSRDGKQWLMVTVDPLWDQERNIVGAVHIVRDITQQRLDEEALRRRNTELVAINAITTTVSQGRNLEEILSGTLDKTLEVTEAEAGSIHLIDDQAVYLVAQRGIPMRIVNTIVRLPLGEGVAGLVAQSGEPISKLMFDGAAAVAMGIWEDEVPFVNCVPIKSRDQVLGALSVITKAPQGLDPQTLQLLQAISHQIGVAVENIRLSQEAAEIEILRELDRLRAELIANVSHELRTPLGLIKVYCSSLLMDDVQLGAEVQKEFLLGVTAETDRLEHIVNNLLDLSRMREGRLQLALRPVDLAVLTRRIVADMAAQPGPHSFICDISSPLVVSADAARIEQVLRNLLVNAVKYSPQGGSITVRADREKSQATIHVADQGIGIPPTEIERVFERFYRVENEVTQRVGGAGLGLAVCQGIVEAHGGQIWATSTVGVGSTFSFTLPDQSGPDETDDPNLAPQWSLEDSA